MTDKLTQYKRAARVLADARLTSLTENTAMRRTFDDAWDGSIAYVLGLANWKFATRGTVLQPDPDVTPAFGRAYVYTKPDDFVRAAAISDDPYFRNQIKDYEVRGNAFLHDTVNPLYLKYVSNDALFGFNIGIWPEHYARMQAIWLALETTMPITKSGGTKASVEGDFQRALIIAKSLDAVDDTVEEKPLGTWTKGRLGFGRASPERDGGTNTPWS